LEHKKQELKYFMTRRIVHLIEEHESRSKLFNISNPYVKAARTLEDPPKTEVPTLDKDKVLSRNPREESQRREVTMTKEDKNRNGKRNIEMKLTGKKA
jgi:hypothetical protein